MKKALLIIGSLIFFMASCSENNRGLQKIYPTTLTQGHSDSEKAKPWAFEQSDIYKISSFAYDKEKKLSIKTGPGLVGIGHNADGAVWALVLPEEPGTLISTEIESPEKIHHIWLRFHPNQLNQIIPPNTLVNHDKKQSEEIIIDPITYKYMRSIAYEKFRGSFHVGMRAYIPEPEIRIYDIGTEKPNRRFFVVNTTKEEIQYEPSMEKNVLPLYEKITPEEAEKNFLEVWHTYDKEYAMFAIRPNVNWDELKEKYLPLAKEVKTTYELGLVIAALLAPLRDLHTRVSVSGHGIPVYHRERISNANPTAFDKLIPIMKKESNYVTWGMTKNNIGYIAVWGWSHQSIPEDVDRILERMRNTRGLIFDVRLNGGGGENLAEQVAGRFLTKEVVYSYSQYRNGPKHDDLTEKFPRKAGPRGPWQYNRPVLLLIGQRCLSSNESFICMMAEADQVTTMGDHTGGSSGNPKRIQLPIDISVRMPRWIDYIADGSLLDKKGIQPDIPFESGPDAFSDNRDDLLQAALDRLSKEPLPDDPIAGRKIESHRERMDMRPWSAGQVVGQPNTKKYGSAQTAWAPDSPNEGEEWLLLEYQSEIHPAGIMIYETNHPGAVYRITLLTSDEEEIEVWKGEDPSKGKEEIAVSEISFDTSVSTKRVKIYLNTTLVMGTNEIDAVALIDEKGNLHWAEIAQASSSFIEIMSPTIIGGSSGDEQEGKTPWGAEQIIGEPNTPRAGDFETAWAPLTADDQEEWIVAEYAEPVVPTCVKIHETYNPGAVSRIVQLAGGGLEIDLWSGDDPLSPEKDSGVAEIPLKIDDPLQKIKIYLDSPKVAGFNEIDAVGLEDRNGTIHWAIDAYASSSYADRD